MKRIATLFFALALAAGTTATAGMSIGHIRQETRFLTDKMAYELELNSRQYDDVYEINFDFVYSLRNVMDAVACGYGWATEAYRTALAVRNDDLRWVLGEWQYSRFLGLDYFYRPLHLAGGRYSFRVYTRYPNRTHYYYGLPTHYRTYAGERRRTHLRHQSHYRGRYVQECRPAMPQRVPHRRLPEQTGRRAAGYTIGVSTRNTASQRVQPQHLPEQPRRRTEGYTPGREIRSEVPIRQASVAPAQRGGSRPAYKAPHRHRHIESVRTEQNRRSEVSF